MIVLMKTNDLHYVRNVFASPDIWDYISDDGAGDVSEYKPLVHESVSYLIPIVDGLPAGCLMIQRLNKACIELHSALFPAFRGKQAGQILTVLKEFVRNEWPDVARLRTWVPSCNRAAYVAAKREKMELVGTEPNSYLKNNELYDLHLFGVKI